MSSFNNPGNAIANAALTRDLPLPAGETECSFAQKLVAAAKGVDLHARLTHFSKYLRRTTDPPPVSDRVALRLAHLTDQNSVQFLDQFSAQNNTHHSICAQVEVDGRYIRLSASSSNAARRYADSHIPNMGIKIPTMGISTSRSGGRAAEKPKAIAAPERTGLADALFTATQQRVLALLFGQPDRSFFATELIGLARTGSGAVQRELKRLVASGLVTVARVGTQKHYQANHASPVFDELRSLVKKTVALHEPIRDALEPFEDRILLAALYGSVAEHKDTASSDIDLLVVSDELTLEQLYSALAPTEDELARKINPTLYTLKEFDRRKKAGSGFLGRILAGEHIVLIGEDVAA